MFPPAYVTRGLFYADSKIYLRSRRWSAHYYSRTAPLLVTHTHTLIRCLLSDDDDIRDRATSIHATPVTDRGRGASCRSQQAAATRFSGGGGPGYSSYTCSCPLNSHGPWNSSLILSCTWTSNIKACLLSRSHAASGSTHIYGGGV